MARQQCENSTLNDTGIDFLKTLAQLWKNLSLTMDYKFLKQSINGANALQKRKNKYIPLFEKGEARHDLIKRNLYQGKSYKIFESQNSG